MKVFHRANNTRTLVTSDLLLAPLVKKTVVNPFWQLTRLLEIIEPSINHVPVLDGSYKLPNGARALPFEMVEVRKKRGVTIHS